MFRRFEDDVVSVSEVIGLWDTGFRTRSCLASEEDLRAFPVEGGLITLSRASGFVSSAWVMGFGSETFFFDAETSEITDSEVFNPASTGCIRGHV